MNRTKELEKEIADLKEMNIQMQKEFDCMSLGVVADFTITDELCVQLRVRDEGKPEEKWTVELMAPEWAAIQAFKRDYDKKEEARQSFQEEVRKHL